MTKNGENDQNPENRHSLAQPFPSRTPLYCGKGNAIKVKSCKNKGGRRNCPAGPIFFICYVASGRDFAFGNAPVQIVRVVRRSLCTQMGGVPRGGHTRTHTQTHTHTHGCVGLKNWPVSLIKYCWAAVTASC